MFLVDSHAHLYFPDFAEDRPAVLERARGAGVRAIINVGIDLESSRQALAQAAARAESDAARDVELFAAAGVHPQESGRYGRDEAALEQLAEELLRLFRGEGGPRLVAVGEIGLDNHGEEPSPACQKAVLRRQLALAGQLDRPVIFHCRDAWPDLLAVLEEEAARRASPLRGVCHCFSGDLGVAQRCLALGLHIGLGGIVTFRSGREVQEVAAALPGDRLLLETDAPFLSPHPLRGRRNEPARVRLVAEKVAELRGVTVQELAWQTSQNAAGLFGLPWPNGDPLAGTVPGEAD